jgi:hypothetical protein
VGSQAPVSFRSLRGEVLPSALRQPLVQVSAMPLAGEDVAKKDMAMTWQ